MNSQIEQENITNEETENTEPSESSEGKEKTSIKSEQQNTNKDESYEHEQNKPDDQIKTLTKNDNVHSSEQEEDSEKHDETLKTVLQDEKEDTEETPIIPTVVVNMGGIQDNVKASQPEQSSVGDTEEFAAVESMYAKRRNDASSSVMGSFTARLVILGSALLLFLLLFALAAVKIDSHLVIGLKPTYQAATSLYQTENAVFNQHKGMALVDVLIEGKSHRTVYTPRLTIGELADIISTGLGNKDTESSTKMYNTNYTKDKIVSNGMQIALDFVEIKYETLTEPLEYTTEIVEVQTIPKGEQVVERHGENGIADREYSYKYVNGELAATEVIRENVIVAATSEIINKGVGGTVYTKTGIPYNFLYYIDVEATAYGVDTGYGGDSVYTYTGKIAKEGIVAVDPEVIPLGTKMFVTGSYGDIGVCYAEDIGEAIVGNKIDIHMGTNLELQLQFGRRDMRVYVLSLPDK